MKRLFAAVLLILLTGSLCAGSPASPELTNVKTASKIGKDNRPADETGTFKTDVPVIYLTGSLKGGAAGTVIKAVWYYNSAEPPVEINNAEYIAKKKNEQFAFKQPAPEGGWPPGSYEVRLYLNGKLKTKAAFTVSDSNLLTSSAAG